MDTEGVIRIIKFVILLILLVLSGIYSSAETALTTVNKLKLQKLSEEGNKAASVALKLLEDSPKMLSAILIMNNIVNLSASSITTTLAIDICGNAFIAVATGILTFVLLLFGEITPKTIATVKSEELSILYSRFIYATMCILTPVIFIIDFISDKLLKLIGIDVDSIHDVITEYELRNIVETSHEDGVIEIEEKEMINNVVDFGDSCVKDVMVPRSEMSTIDVEASFSELKDMFFDKKYTRLPVYEESIDNIVGIVNMKDVLFYEDYEGFSIKNIMREPSFTIEFKKTSDLLIEMRQNSLSMSVVLDEYGVTVGLVTLEDLLEEIVGEIRDEFDEDEEELIQQVGEREYIVDGSLKLDDINDALDTEFESEEYDSIGGLIIQTLSHIPETGEEAVLEDGTVLSVISMDKNHIEKVKIVLPEPLPEENVEE